MKRFRVGSYVHLHGSFAIVTGGHHRRGDYRVFVFNPSYFANQTTWWARSAPIQKAIPTFVGFVIVESARVERR